MPSETVAPALSRDLAWHPVTAQGHVHMPVDTAVSPIQDSKGRA